MARQFEPLPDPSIPRASRCIRVSRRIRSIRRDVDFSGTSGSVLDFGACLFERSDFFRIETLQRVIAAFHVDRGPQCLDYPCCPYLRKNHDEVDALQRGQDFGPILLGI